MGNGALAIGPKLSRPSSTLPNVWSGRALQADFAELAVSGFASMYPASHDWSVWCSGPSWISARVRQRAKLNCHTRNCYASSSEGRSMVIMLQ
jgi:hypothetical protein